MENVMIKSFKEALKTDGRTLKWFHDNYVKDQTGLTYNAMALQLNGYTSLNPKVKLALCRYLDRE